MKQVKFLLTAITIILIASCATVSVAVEETTGELILTNIPEQYNGMLISAQNNLEDDFVLLAVDSIASNGRSTGAVVRNGTARLNVWQASVESDSNYRVFDYRGNDTAELTIMIHLSDRAFQPWSVSYDGTLGSINVEFIDGKASFPFIFINEETVGELVITNIPARFNGRLVSAQTNFGNNPFLVGVDSASNFISVTAAVIENGSATLKVWEILKTDLLNYNRNDSVEFQLFIHHAGTTTYNPGSFNYNVNLPNINVVFNNGRAEHRLR